MAMAACYPNYDISTSSGISQHQQQPQLHHHLSVPSRLSNAGPMAQKDYSIPLHVDCSVEYELPNQAKPPVGARVEPLLMIHPCYFRKMESQRRSPFVNNMPNSSRSSNSIVANVVDSSSMSRRSSKSSSQQVPQQHVVVSSHQNSIHHHQNLQQQIDEYVQRQMAQRSQQAHYPVGTSSQQHQQQQHQQQQQQQQQQSQHLQSQHHRHHSHQPQPPQSLHQQQQQQQQSHLTSQQSTNQYSLQSQQQQHQQQQQQQLANTSDWSRYMGQEGVVRNYGKMNLANQTAYSTSKSKIVKRSNTGMPQLAHAVAAGPGQQQQQQQLQHHHHPNLIPASCAAFNSSSSLEGGLPSGPRWDIEKTSMAAVPRDFQAGPESLPIKANASLLASGTATQIASSNNNNYQPSATMYRNPSVVGKRDAMLSGGCGVYSNSSNNNNNNNLSNNNNTELGLTASGLWDSAALLEKSPMAAIPRDYQAGPEHMACSKMGGDGGVVVGTSGTTAGGAMLAASGHSLMRSAAAAAAAYAAAAASHHSTNSNSSSSSNSISNSGSSSSNNNSNSSLSSSSGYHSDKAALFAGKYRQHQRVSHRLHPYMMTSSIGGSFPALVNPAFPPMQQVSCYNV